MPSGIVIICMSTETTPSSSPVATDLDRYWRLLLGVGVLIAVLGVLAVLAPLLTGISLSILLGALLVVGALGHVANAFSAGGWKGSLWQVVLALVYGFAGITLIANPVVGLASLTILVVVYLLFTGIVELGMGFAMRPESGWGWVVISGAVSLALAGLLWVGLPSTALWAIGVLFGVSLLTSGLSLVGAGLAARRAGTAARGESAGTGSPGT